jgi:hypothetical protein
MAEGVMPPKAFMEYCMGMTQEQITLTLKMIEEEMGSELGDIIKATIKLDATPPPTPVLGPKPLGAKKPMTRTQPAAKPSK